MGAHVGRLLSMKTIRLFAFLSALSALGGCSSPDKVDIGDNSPPASLGSKLSDYAGSWTGYAEAFQFSDGTDIVRLVLNEGGEGTFEVGEDGPEPTSSALDGPPTGYDDVEGIVVNRKIRLVPRYSYVLRSSNVTDKRLKVATESWQPNRPYCASFAPTYDYSDGRYSCLPTSGWSSSGGSDVCHYDDQNGESQSFPCILVECRWSCACNETACSSFLEGSEPDINIDSALSDADTLVGTLNSPEGRVTVRLQKN